ncbi:MAG: glutamate 5-kinase [bacterium]
MNESLKVRQSAADVRRVVVKIGSRVLVQKTGRPEHRRIKGLVNEMAKLRQAGVEVLVVTSGAIGAGMEALGMTSRPTELPDLQMAAAVGQCRLMATYDKLFAAKRCKVGQVLLTHDDFNHKIRLTNARRTIENMLRHKVIPIVNENDVVADEEIRADIKLGDNDFLASLVVRLIRADLLIILSTVDGVRAPGVRGGTRRVPYLEKVDKNTLALVTGQKGNLSTGGMGSKLRAAKLAAQAGCHVVIADGRRPCNITRVVKGEDVGTFIVASL